MYTRLYGGGRKEGTVYLTTHSTHCIYGYMAAEGRNCLFNDTLNTLYIRLYGGGRKEGNVLLNDAFNTLYTQLYGGRRKEGTVYLTTHSTHCIYGYMAADTW